MLATAVPQEGGEVGVLSPVGLRSALRASLTKICRQRDAKLIARHKNFRSATKLLSKALPLHPSGPRA